jgi:hypothetical protein
MLNFGWEPNKKCSPQFLTDGLAPFTFGVALAAALLLQIAFSETG